MKHCLVICLAAMGLIAPPGRAQTITHTAPRASQIMVNQSRTISPIYEMGFNSAKTSETKWEFSHRIQGGWEHDNNIYESSTRRATSGSTRLLLSTLGTRRSEREHFQFAYAAAFQSYSGHRDENKLTHELSGQFGVRLWPWLHVSSEANAMLKLYLENVADYGTTFGDIKASAKLPHKIVADFSVETGQLDYAQPELHEYDFTFLGFAIGLHHSLSPTTAVEANFNRRFVHYPRESSISLMLPESPSARTDRRDVLTTWRVAMTGGRKLLAQIAIEAQTNRSSNVVYDFDRWRVNGLLGFRPARRWMLRTAVMLQHKRYRKELPPIYLIDLDTEREQSNFVVVDLSRDLTAVISLVARAAFYDNESTVRSLFYQKTLYFAGFELRL